MDLQGDSNEGHGQGTEQRVFPSELNPPTSDAKTLFVGGLNATDTK